MTISAILLAFAANMTDSVSTKSGPVDSSAPAAATASAATTDTSAATSVDSAATAPRVEAAPRDSVVAGPTDFGPVMVVPPPPAGPVGLVAQQDQGPIGPVGFGPVDLADSRPSGSKGASTLGAIGRSLLIPGWGHRYLGYRGRAVPYISTDLVAWAGLFGSWLVGKAAIANAAELANRHAGASLGSDPDPELLSQMRTYRSRRAVNGRHDSYNEAMVVSGKDAQWQFPDDAAHDWDWGTRENAANDAHIRDFEDQIQLWNGSRVAMYSTIGALALVRLVATMDVLRLVRSDASRAGISLQALPRPDGMDAALAVNF